MALLGAVATPSPRSSSASARRATPRDADGHRGSGVRPRRGRGPAVPPGLRGGARAVRGVPSGPRRDARALRVPLDGRHCGLLPSPTPAVLTCAAAGPAADAHSAAAPARARPRRPPSAAWSVPRAPDSRRPSECRGPRPTPAASSGPPARGSATARAVLRTSPVPGPRGTRTQSVPGRAGRHALGCPCRTSVLCTSCCTAADTGVTSDHRMTSHTSQSAERRARIEQMRQAGRARERGSDHHHLRQRRRRRRSRRLRRLCAEPRAGQEEQQEALAAAPVGEEKTWDKLTQNHVDRSRSPTLMNPPVGGDHHRAWMDCNGNVYEEEIPTENAVHSWSTARSGSRTTTRPPPRT